MNNSCLFEVHLTKLMDHFSNCVRSGNSMQEAAVNTTPDIRKITALTCDVCQWTKDLSSPAQHFPILENCQRC